MDNFNVFKRLDVTEFQDGDDKIKISLPCTTIRIGDYRFEAKHPVVITSKGIKIVAPIKNGFNDLHIQDSEIVKMTVHFNKQLSVMFIYTKPSCGEYILDQLSLTRAYFWPLSRKEKQKKLILLTENVSEEVKDVFRSIFSNSRLEEINSQDANAMLDRSINLTSAEALIRKDRMLIAESDSEDEDMQKLLTYPQCRGGIAITAYDYLCLGNELLTKTQQPLTHIFSTFFYKKLTTITANQKALTVERHKQIKSWTKNVDLFEKDFLIVPINEESHWFLAIICFPNLTEPHTFDTKRPIQLNRSSHQDKFKRINSKQYEIDSDESDDEMIVIDKGQPVKQPCILIFDSLAGKSRSRVVETLRDYLTCEYNTRNPNSPRQYTKKTMAECLVKVPQQKNLTDCGLFLLQYVEQFFKDPLKDFRIPIKSLSKWFHQNIVTRKREDIGNLIKTLMKREGISTAKVPDVDFPTRNGRILEVTPLEDIQESDSEYLPSEDDQEDYSSQEEFSSLLKTRRYDKNNNCYKSAPRSHKSRRK